MGFVFSILATLFFVLLLYLLKEGKEYEYMVEELEGYPLSELYIIGFALLEIKQLPFKRMLLPKLIKKSALLNGRYYAEYYANVALAQAFSFITIIIFLGFGFAAVFGGGSASFLILFVALIGCAFVWNFSVLTINDEVKKRRESCSYDFPDMVTKFALLINSGMVLHEAWQLVSQNGDTELYKLMRESCDLMDEGWSDSQAIIEFGIKTDSPEIKKFTSSMVQGIEKGNTELADFLLEQSNEMVARKRQILLQKGEAAAGKLIIPIAITFLGIILIIGFNAMQSMSF